MNICTIQTKVKKKGKIRFKDIGDFLYAKKGDDIVVVVGGQEIKRSIDRIWLNEGLFLVDTMENDGSCINLKLK